MVSDNTLYIYTLQKYLNIYLLLTRCMYFSNKITNKSKYIDFIFYDGMYDAIKLIFRSEQI